ncbi:solute carrier organic anion transporter family member 4A1-like isoform X2 [Cimex lectularius]|uniref:Solute carrier organic anion transporter family member n=1 Tax=Cimex lectularius TaxID=79782 RepID=A0A8I6RWF1_CIMLE|nr:solute carrier organic anion transporter family member 4A1-like isoform X2 [Cimex lectularius]XP_014252614.1 solute carrier organic anion transporter family member 4A1-like isoform X2 [Cimex lectularius]XP_014252615.1 solute carrier organic anion transporter family member 4A1-like isoform X2 [Cimex lectularius]XP_024086256.1 solute carrier organic anion transporter family member 4A1-like isoform X2 [Cimex lectularius]XP_024086257.1 solute carrier organic anion transporter family member 4A1-l
MSSFTRSFSLFWQSNPRPAEMERSNTRLKSETSLYGWFMFTPYSLQCLATPYGALVILCLQTLLQGTVVNGMLRHFSSMIEIRFGLSSLSSGIMMGVFDFACVLCLIPVTFFGGAKTSNRPKYIGFGTMIIGTGSLIFSMPAFLTGPYRPAKSDLCTDNAKAAVRGEENVHNYRLMYSMLVVGNFLHGVGATPFFTLSVSYIDDMATKEKSSIFLGIYYMMAVIGPALGYLFGGILGDVHVDFFRPESQIQKDITPASTQWVGAWWLGFLVCGCISYFIAIPVLGLPRQLKVKKEEKKSKMKESIMVESSFLSDQPTLKEFFPALFHIFKNFPFMFLTFAGCWEAIILSGMGAFMPKLLRRQFGFSSPKVATIMGSVAIPSCLIGLLLGGYVIKKWNLSTTSILKLCIALTSAAGFLQTGLLIFCKENVPNDLVEIIGTNDNIELLRWGLEEKCNANCNCGQAIYFPICDVNNASYFSPCTAGCRDFRVISKSSKFYYNCSCIKSKSSEGWSAKICEENCEIWKVTIFLITVFCYQTVTFSACIPAITATLRSIHPDLKSLGLGIQWLMVRIFGSVPGSVIYGALIDQACVYWPKDFGACIVYDQGKFGRNIALFGVNCKVFELICFFIAYRLYKYQLVSDSKRVKQSVILDKSAKGITGQPKKL